MSSEVMRTGPRTRTGAERSVSSAVVGSSEFTELARRIKDAGLMRRRYGYYWTKLIAVPVGVMTGVVS